MIPLLHIVTDDEVLARPDFPAFALEVLQEGGPSVAFHLRGPRTPGGVLFTLAETLLGRARDSGSVLLVNDRIDLALCLDPPGAHLGQRSLPPAAARKIMGPQRILGVSVHSVEEAVGALKAAVDFLMVGTIFPTSSHPDVEVGGMDRVRAVAGMARVPVVTIGGMTPERVADLLEAGAHGVAVRGGIWDARDPKAACAGYLEVLTKGGGP